MEFKNYVKCVAVSFAALGLFSCSSDEADVVSATDPAEIRLSGELSTVSAGTRGAGPITGTTPSAAVGNLSLDIFRADEVYTTAYASAAIAGTMATGTGDINLSTTQYYQTDPDKTTRLIALYPAGGTYVSAARTITFSSFDGTNDIMASQLVEGSRNSPFNPQGAATMTFTHLLTQVKVSVKAVDAPAAADWGSVTNISIKNKGVSNCVVTLPMANTTIGAVAEINGTESGDLVLMKKEDGDAVANIDLTTNPTTLKHYGCAMFLPGTATLILSITTSKGSIQELPIGSSLSLIAGTAYGINITFNRTGITVTAELTDWSYNSGDDKNIEIG